MVTRTAEKKQLESLYAESGNHLAVLYGRRGAGKHQLLQELCEGKRVFYHRVRNASAGQQLRQLQSEIESAYEVRLTKGTYDECFNRIKSGDASKLIVIIDDVDLACKRDHSFMESILKLKARRLYPGPVLIILCSAAVSWCRESFEAYLGEDAKRVDAWIPVGEATFLDVVRAFPDYSVAQCTETYGILGGVPAYLNRWDGTESIRSNICKHILAPEGFLYGEAESFLAGELRELGVYETILASLAAGNEKLGDLYADTGYSRAKISVYLRNLAAFDVVEKVVSFETGGWDNAKKGVYRISNSYLSFWFTFVYPHLSELFLLSPEEFYDKHIAPSLEGYLHRYFVDVCAEYLALMGRMGKLPLRISSMGTWVGKRGTIDIIGQDAVRRNVVGLCNWSKDVLTMDDFTELLKNLKRAKLAAEVYYLFSAKSFAPELVELEKQDNRVVLVDMTEL